MKPLNSSPYKFIIGEYFHYTFEFDFLDIVATILARIDEIETATPQEIFETVDSTIVYTNDEWTILQFYCEPHEADLSLAFNELVSDISNIVDIIRKELANGTLE